MTLRGRALDDAIEKELLTMLEEGFENSPISPSALHQRLVCKGIIRGGLSTLSKSTSLERHNLISYYIDKKLSPLNLKNKEKQQYINGRTREAFVSQNARLKEKIANLEDRLSENTMTLIAIIKEVNSKTSVRTERIIAPHIIREMRNKD